MPQPHDPESPQSRGLIPILLVAWTGGGAFVLSLAYFLYSYLYRFGRAVADGPVLPAATLDVLLFSAFAMHHSLFARTPLKRWVGTVAPPALERSLYTWFSSL